MDQSPYEREVGKDSFRVLLLGPGKDNQPICCTLLACNFLDNIPYEAISYAWGDEISKATISCNSTDLAVTQDLESCLTALRSDSETRTLWIDQICINQNDVDEKSAQVSIMGAIYRSAARVVVWLGPASPDSDQALSFIVELCLAFSAYYHLHGGEGDPLGAEDEIVRIEPSGFELPARNDPQWMALSEVLDRKWFSRYWIVQEVMANDKVIVQCGDCQLDWWILRWLNWVLQQYSPLLARLSYNERDPAGPGLLAALGDAENWRSNHQTASTEASEISDTNSLSSFSMLLQIFSRQSVKLDCDRIYSLLGLANSPVLRHINVDYRLSTCKVYMDLAVKSMKNDCNLNYLNFVEYSEDTTLEELPSWVPDWTNAPKSKSKGIKDMDYDLFRASGPQPIHEPFRVSGTKLLVTARLIDVIGSQRMKFPTVAGALIGRGVDYDKLILSYMEEDVEFYGLVENAIDACQPYGNRETTSSTMCRLLLRDWFRSPMYDGPTIGNYEEGIRELREYTPWLREAIDKFQECGDSIAMKGWLDSIAMKGWLLLHPEPVTKYCGTVSFVTVIAPQLRGNAIVKTREGFMANVPQQAKTGDIIAIVNGCRTPLILRRCEPNGYILIGDCYVHGIMYGEAMEMGFDETGITLI